MANIKELNTKVASLRSMQKVMRAMNMIASTKLHRMVGRLPALKVFQKGALDMARDVAMAYQGRQDPLIQSTAGAGRATVVMFTADKGLCGSHNHSVNRAALALIRSMEQKSMEVDTVCVGLRGAAFCHRYDLTIHLSTESGDRDLTADALREMSGEIVGRVAAGEVESVHFVYNAFVSTLQQTLTTARILPLSSLLPAEMPARPAFALETGTSSPRASVEVVFFFLLQAALRHSRLSEHAARMTAMDNATNNSDDLIARYTAIRNRVRQSRITSDLIEIVAGKEALKDQ